MKKEERIIFSLAYILMEVESERQTYVDEIYVRKPEVSAE